MYYVTTTASGQDCPSTHQQYCNPLSYYCSLVPDQWSPNITLIFLPGVHDCGTRNFKVEGVNQLVLNGHSAINDSSVIKCNQMVLNNISSLFIANLRLKLALESSDPKGYYALSLEGITHTILLENVSVSNVVGNVIHVKCFGSIIINDAFITGKWECLDIFSNGSSSSGSNSNFNHVNLTNITFDHCFIGGAFGGDSYYITLTNITMLHGYVGIQLTGSKNSMNVNGLYACLSVLGISSLGNGHYVTISDVTILNCYYGIVFRHSGGYINATNVFISNTTEIGLYVENCDHAYLSNILVTKSYEGLYLSDIKDFVILINITITNNSNSGLHAEGRINLKFSNYPSTISNNNSPGNGGGMWISEGVALFSNTTVLFLNNTAKGVGGAIYSSSVTNTILTLVYENKPCTLAVFEDNFKPLFLNNTAVLGGDNIYGGHYWGCCNGVAYSNPFCLDTNLYSRNIMYFSEMLHCFDNKLFKSFQQKPISSLVTSRPLGVCICNEDNAINCSTRSVDRLIYPGQSISLSLATVGVCGGISPGELVTSNSSMTEVVLLNASQATSGRNCIKFGYKAYSQFSNGSIFLKHAADPGERILPGYSLRVNVTFLSCPVGLTLSSKACQCNIVIESINGTQCSIDWMPHPIRRPGNNWLSYNQQYNCTVAHKNCPFDYCNTTTVYLNLTHSDLQCTNGRSGTLCGECQSGLSLTLGSNKCESCSNKYLSLVVAFIVAGIALVVFLLACNLTVSVGSINGLLFYANMIKLNETALFPNGVSIPVLSQFIAWLNFDLGIQTCFFNGLDGYWKTWLQFVFPVYIWLLIGIIIIGSYYSGRLSRLCGNNSVPVLSTLVLISYNKLLRTITNAMMFATMKCEGDQQWSVWSFDGNIKYFHGKHIPLFLVALIFLLIGLVYTVLVFSAQWLQRYSGKCCKSSHDPVVKLKPFLDAYTGPYKDKYKYWTGLLLIVRLLLTTVFSYTTGTVPQYNNYIIVFISSTLLFLSRGEYRNNVLNLLEYFYLFNLVWLSLVNSLSNHMGYSYHTTITLTAVSVGISLFAFVGIVLAHILKKYCGSKSSIIKCTRRQGNDFQLHQVDVEDKEMYSPAEFVINDREPLIFDY